MTFAEHRHRVYQATVLSLDFFAEAVEIGGRAVRAKIAYESQLARGKAGKGNEQQRTVDENDRILVSVSRDASWEFGLPTRPRQGTALRRAVERDPDVRPFQFQGEVEFEGDVSACYIFQRPRRNAQGGR